MAGYPVAAGRATYTGDWIPEIWSPKLLLKFYDATSLSETTNTDYEGDIRKAGDKVIIRTTPDILIRDYVKGANLNFQVPKSDPIELLVDQGKYWAFVLDTVDARQMDLNAVEAWTSDAAVQLKIAIETAILAADYTYAHASNKGATAGVKSASYNLGVSGTPFALTKTNILDFIVDMGSVLDEQNVPDEGRYLRLPPIFCGMIKKSDLKDASLSGDGKSLLRNGRLGMIDRFTIYSTNLQVWGTDGSGARVCNITAGHKSATCFATQLTENDQGPNPFGFGQLFKGLQVYGWKVNKPEALVHGYVKKG